MARAEFLKRLAELEALDEEAVIDSGAPLAAARCRAEDPALLLRHGRRVACHAVEEGRDR